MPRIFQGKNLEQNLSHDPCGETSVWMKLPELRFVFGHYADLQLTGLEVHWQDRGQTGNGQLERQERKKSFSQNIKEDFRSERKQSTTSQTNKVHRGEKAERKMLFQVRFPTTQVVLQVIQKVLIVLRNAGWFSGIGRFSGLVQFTLG